MEDAVETSLLTDEANAGRWKYMIPVLVVMFLNNGIQVNVLPDQLLAFFGERTIVITTTIDFFTAILSFLCSPLLGRFSDRYGRRISLTVSLAALSLPCVPLVFTGNLLFHIALRPFTAIGQGLTGLAFAYGADVSPIADRAYVYGMLSATYQLTFTISPYCGALLFEHVSCPKWGWAVTLVFYLIGLLYIVLVLPEARSMKSAEVGVPSLCLQLNPVASLSTALRDKRVRCLSLVLSGHSIIFMGLLGTFPTYATEYIGFDKFDRALYQGVVGATQTAAALSASAVVLRFGARNALFAAVAVQSVALVGASAATGRKPALYSALFMILQGIITPTTCSLASGMSSRDVQGHVQGAMTGVQLLSEGVGPLLFAVAIHAFWSAHSNPGLAYTLGLAVVALELLAVHLALPSNNAHGNHDVIESRVTDRSNTGYDTF